MSGKLSSSSRVADDGNEAGLIFPSGQIKDAGKPGDPDGLNRKHTDSNRVCIRNSNRVCIWNFRRHVFSTQLSAVFNPGMALRGHRGHYHDHRAIAQSPVRANRGQSRLRAWGERFPVAFDICLCGRRSWSRKARPTGKTKSGTDLRWRRSWPAGAWCWRSRG